MLQILGWIKWIFPNPVNDAKAFIATIVSAAAVFVYATDHTDTKHDEQALHINKLHTQQSFNLEKQKIESHDRLAESNETLMEYLKQMNQHQTILNSDLKKLIMKNSDKLWELSREKNKKVN